MPDEVLAGFFADLARLYPDLDTGFLRGIGREFEQVAVAGGHTLVRRGDPSDALYILISGRLVATREDDLGRIVRLGEIGRGEMIGEMSLLSGGTRTATVTALRDSRLVRISNETFLQFMQRHPSVTRQFIQILISRLTHHAPRHHEKLSTLAVICAGITDETAAFCRELESAVRGMAKVMLVDRARIEASFPGALDGAGDDRIATWLNEQEQQHGLMLYACEPGLSAWTRLCLRQADRVLIVAQATDGADDHQLTAVERHLYGDDNGGGLRGCELVLLQAQNSSLPAGTARWLASRRLRRHHHLRRGDAAGMERLCRHLVGRSIGLALGGGGAKAFAEIGVLRALEEARIPVDVIGGTSMGAVVGALAALGHDARTIQETLRAALVLKPFSGVTLPLVSLLSGKRLERMMRMLFEDIRIEDLWRRYYCVSCNLTLGSVYPAESGLLRQWVMASSAVPGIVPPIIDHGELFVDGALLNNVPADLMSALNSGPVIAVNVSSVTELKAGVPDDTDLSGWSVLMGNLAMRRESQRAPGLGRILVRSMLMASANHAATMRNYAALYLDPPLAGIDVADWHAFDALVETGYVHAKEALAKWDHKNLM